MKNKKISRSYRLDPKIVDLIDDIQKYEKDKGLNTSQSDIVTKAILYYNQKRVDKIV